jgi:DNA-binding Lrp family transcriptional regulator
MLEEKSREVLNILSHDSRTSADTIARMIGLTTAEVQKIIDDFEKSGVIKQYHTTINWDKAGVDKIVAFIDVRVQPAREVGFDAVALRIARHPQVQSAWLVSGGSDLRLLVETTTMNELANFVAEKLATVEGVTGTNTHFLLRTYKDDYALFTEPDVDGRLVISP